MQYSMECYKSLIDCYVLPQLPHNGLSVTGLGDLCADSLQNTLSPAGHQQGLLSSD